MIDEETRAARLTLEEIAVLREAARWRRENGWEFRLSGLGFSGQYGYLEWSRYIPELRGRKSVVFDRGDDRTERLGINENTRRTSYAYMEVKGVAHALDLLAAGGMLPARFSTAYRAGWEARETATDSDGALDLITWPECRPAWEPSC